MLQLCHLKKTYNKKVMFTDIDYTFDQGKIYSILGGIGAGRTTLFECISGDIVIDSGEIKTKEKSTIFYAAKQSVLPMYLTSYEYIKGLCLLSNDETDADDYLDRVKMNAEVRDQLICDMGFESKKRLQLAAFLVQKPYVILFDEPFDYCDEQYITDFIEVLDSVKDEHIILISTGLLDISKKISDDLIVLNNGELNYISEETLEVPEVKRAVMDILGEAGNEII